MGVHVSKQRTGPHGPANKNLNGPHRISLTFWKQFSNEKPAPEYPTAGAEAGFRVYSDQGKRIGPVFSSVEKAQDYLSGRWGF